MRFKQWIAESDRQRSRFAFAAALVGLAGCVSLTGEDSAKRTLGSLIDDQAIERLAARQIAAADERLSASQIKVASFDGIVLLTGQVADETLRSRAEKAIGNIRKIRKVHNDIRVGGTSTLLARSNDRWLSTKVSASLRAAEDVPANQLKVVTENGVVYLLGRVPVAQGDAAATVASSVLGVQKVVKVFEYL
jgi:osmotically-inducible protein OsmY